MKCYKIVAGTVHSYANGKIVIAYMDKEAMDLDGENSDYYATIPRCIKDAKSLPSSSTGEKRKLVFPCAPRNMPM